MTPVVPHLLVVSGRDTSVVPLEGLPVELTLIQTKDRATVAQINASTRVLVLDLANEKLVMGLVESIHASSPLTGVMCFLEPYLVLAGRLRDFLGVAGFSERAATLSKNKIEMRERLDGCNLPKVRWRQANDGRDLIAALKAFDTPLIVKPADGWASEGVSLVRRSDQAEEAFAKAKRCGSRVIAEEFIDGPEFSVEAITKEENHEVLAVTRKATTGPPNFVELGHVQPPNLSHTEEQRIREVVTQLLKIIGVEWGPTHTEIRLRDGEPYVIETHTRYGGDRIWELTEFTTGVPIQRTTACYILGLQEPQRMPKAKAACVRFLTAKPGLVESVFAPEVLPSGVERIDVSVKPGDRVRELSSSFARCGYVLTTGTTPAEAEKLALEQAERITIITKEIT
jgi:biotin carboxylase